MEDEAFQRETLIDFLGQNQFRASGVDSGAALRKLVEKDPPALVLLDLRLPGGEDGFALAVFVSANAVAHFLAEPGQPAWPPGTLAGSTGPGTTAALRQAGVPAACIREPAAGAERLDSEALWQQLRALDWRGARALIVRGEGGRDWLADTLRAAGAEVEFVTAYRRALPRFDEAQAALLAAAQADPAGHVWHFSSSEAVHHLPRLAPGARWQASAALATHPRIGEAARAIGFGDVQVLAPGLSALLAAWKALQAGRRSPGETRS